MYSTSHFGWINHLLISYMDYPWSLASCQHHNCLYAGDYKLQHIWRFDRHNYSVLKWFLDDKPTGLSLTRSHHLLVTLENSKKICEYTTCGILTREIILDVSIDNPQHSIELSSGQFLVSSLGRYFSSRVCIVDTKGQIVQSYGERKGSSVGQLNEPCCLAVDKHGYVLVADYINNKVQILSPALTHLCDINLPGHELTGPSSPSPRRLPNGRLYMAELDKGRVFVKSVADLLR